MHRFARPAAAALLALTTTLVISQVKPAAPQTERFPQFDNEDVKVWKTIVQPHQPLAPHTHLHARVIIALTGGTMNLVYQNGGPTEVHKWETGKAYWLPANPPNTTHTDVNVGDKPIEVMVVELQKDK
jgi:quercetin dioxygenase-like cupin family protein